MEKTSETLIMVFTRDMIAGRVKTRIGRVLGDAVALDVHQRLCLHTRRIVEEVAADKWVWMDQHPIGAWLWGDGVFRCMVQQGSDLGERMAHAFQVAFQAGYRRVLIIGTDCPGLTADLLKDSISRLGDDPAVIGPAADGGYYLLGLTVHIPELFTGKAWSTDRVFASTIADLEDRGIRYSSLPVLTDVDTPDDLIHLQGIP
ncbi:MAG: TIGR04282 family arsenosugar biosynthesis glycosyltransferase [Bacteroidota bacterium]